MEEPTSLRVGRVYNLLVAPLETWKKSAVDLMKRTVWKDPQGEQKQKMMIKNQLLQHRPLFAQVMVYIEEEAFCRRH